MPVACSYVVLLIRRNGDHGIERLVSVWLLVVSTKLQSLRQILRFFTGVGKGTGTLETDAAVFLEEDALQVRQALDSEVAVSYVASPDVARTVPASQVRAHSSPSLSSVCIQSELDPQGASRCIRAALGYGGTL